MKVLFYVPEQHGVSWEDYPANYELRLPILHCGIVSASREYCFQRVLRTEGRDAMNQRAFQEVLDFHPDVLVNATSWPNESVDPVVLREIMKLGIPVFTAVFDTHIEPRHWELQWFDNCNYFGVVDSITNYERYCSLANGHPNVKGVLYLGGNNVFTDVFHKQNTGKIYDVVLLGSADRDRTYFIDYLRDALRERSIGFHKLGGYVDSKQGAPNQLSDDWVTLTDYVKIINQTKICVSSQTAPERIQLKGKVFQYLACGTFCLTDSNPELRHIVPDQCLATYDSYEACIEKISYYMAHEDERERITDAGYKWFHETFDYKNFWSRILRDIAGGERFCERGING